MKWTKSRKLLSEHIKNSSKMSQKWCWDIHDTRIQSSKNARDLWQPERRQQRVHHWSSSFIVDQTRALVCISLSFLHEYDVKLQISLFMEDVKTPDDDILFLFFSANLENYTPEKAFLHAKYTRWNYRDGVRNSANCLVEWRICCRRSRPKELPTSIFSSRYQYIVKRKDLEN